MHDHYKCSTVATAFFLQLFYTYTTTLYVNVYITLHNESIIFVIQYQSFVNNIDNKCSYFFCHLKLSSSNLIRYTLKFKTDCFALNMFDVDSIVETWRSHTRTLLQTKQSLTCKTIKFGVYIVLITLFLPLSFHKMTCTKSEKMAIVTLQFVSV